MPDNAATNGEPENSSQELAQEFQRGKARSEPNTDRKRQAWRSRKVGGQLKALRFIKLETMDAVHFCNAKTLQLGDSGSY